MMVYPSVDSSFCKAFSKMTVEQQKEEPIMKSTYETMGGKYRQFGNYLLPNLEAPENPKVGDWGKRRRKYLREHQKALYTAMMLGDTLNAHLEEVDHTATEMYDHLSTQLAKQEGVTEELKANHQMEWVQRTNSIRNRAAEVVCKGLIYV